MTRSSTDTLPTTVDRELEEDWEVEAQLGTVSDDQWSELWIVANQILELEVPGVWHGGNVIDHTEDGRNVYVMPFIVYGEPVNRYMQLWDEMGLVVPYGTVLDNHPRNFDHLEWLDSSSISDVVRFGSAILRLERFGDGLIGEAIETGAIAIVVRRLKEWRQSQLVGETTVSDVFADWFKSYRDSCRWQTAKSEPPHEYTIRDWRPEAASDFDRAAAGIREFGYSQSFYQHTYIYFDLDGLKYWTMGNPQSEPTVLNRDPVESRYG